MIISILPGNGKDLPLNQEMKFVLSNASAQMTFKKRSVKLMKTQHILQNLLTITEKLMMEGHRRAIIK
jgi:hypothetical protein